MLSVPGLKEEFGTCWGPKWAVISFSRYMRSFKYDMEDGCYMGESLSSYVC